MDVGGTTASATATPESTVLAEKSSITPKAVNETSSTSDKNGSIPDSSLDSMKDSTGVADSSKDVAKASMLPEKKTMDTIASNASESSSKGELQKIPVKLSSVSSGDPMMTNKDGEAKVLTSSDKGITAKSDHHKDELDHDDDDDDLLKRMEAIEKGEDIVIPVKYEQKKDDPTHQNGMLEKMPEKQIEVVPPKLKDAGKTGESVAKPSQSSSLTKVVAPVAESCLDKPVEAVNPNAKRKHSLNETESNEPEMKKAHVDDLTLEPKSSPPKTSSEKTSSPTKLSSESSAGPSVSKSNFVEKPLEKPPSVEKMEVDGSPESDVSSPKSVDTISNVEPNSQPGTTVEDKSEEISSSVVEETMRQESDCTESGKMDNSNVSSSDDKREGTSGKIKPVENEVSASVLPTPSEEEAMDVDEDGNDVAESSTPAATNAAAGSVPVEEPLCIKKVAYLCTDEEQRGEQKGDSKSMGATEKPCGSSLATSSTLTASAKTASTSEVTERMEVDSATKATSGTAGTTKPLIQCEEVVDSSNATVPTKKPVVERAEKSLGSISLSNVAAISEESFVESTQPSSSSDTKKQSAVENRMNDQAREVGLRAGLQTKPTSTPKNTSVSLVPSSINPSTLKTLNPLRTSAVSSSNVCSATSVQPNMAKVSSGSVNKATNPATSPVESRRSEVGDTTTMTTTTTSTVETASVAKKAGLLTTNAESSMSSKAETEALPLSTMSGATSASSVKSSPPKKESHREESKGNLNTADPSEVDSCTAAVSDTNTSEDVNVFLTNVRKLNGISSTSGGTEMDVKTDVANSHTSVKQEDDNVKASNSSEQLHLLGTVCGMASPEQQYEVTIWCEGQDLQFMSVKRIVDEKMVREPAATTSDGALHGVCKIDSSSKQTSTGPSSNGRSGNSIGPSKLSETHIASSGQPSENSSSSTLTVSEVKSTQSPSVPYLKQTISGSKALCDLMIEKFKKLRQFYAPDDGSESAEGLAGDTDAHLLKIPKTPVNARGGQRKESAKKSTPRGQKRNKTVDTDDDDDSSANNARTPRSTGSSATKQPAKRTKGGLSISPNESPIVTSTLSPKVKNSIEPKQFDICCLARWTDRKYYAGRVTNYREDNKYVVVFEDGCSKTLSRDIIVFGEDGVLPIQHHSIHALTGNDTYEPAIVEEIKRNELNEVVYFVRTAARTLTITATDIYLTDEQAKWIHNACKDKPNPIQQLLQSGSDAASTMDGGDRIAGTVGTVSEGTGSLTASDLGADNGNKGARSTRSTKLVTPEAGYSGGVGKKGRRGRRLS